MAILEMYNDKFIILGNDSADQDYIRLGIPDSYHSGMTHWQQQEFEIKFNEKNIFEIKEINNIPLGSKYIIYCSVYSHLINLIRPGDDTKYKYDFVNHVGGSCGNIAVECILPERILKDSLDGNVLWIINHDTESEIATLFHYDILYKSLGCSRHPDNIVLLTGASLDYMYEDQSLMDITRIQFNSLLTFLKIGNTDNFIANKLNDINNKKIVKYKSLCYNRVPKKHRMIILSHMLQREYITDCIHSLGLTIYGEISRLFISDEPSKYGYLQESFNKICDLNENIVAVMEEDIDLTINHAGTMNYTHPLNSSFHVVTESCTTDYTFITEKSYKPFVMMQPFIQFGSVNNIQQLRQMGFRVFDKWINHSYDGIRDDHGRMQRFLIELDRLHGIDHEEWANMLYDMREDLYFNFNLINKMRLDNPPLRLITILYDFANENYT